MARFKFRDGFWLNVGGNDPLSPDRIWFGAGEQTVPDEYADHWFVLEMGECLDVETVAPAAAEPATVAAASTDVSESVPIEAEGSTHVETAEEISEKEALRVEADALGIVVDGRWGIARMKAEIEAKKAAVAAAAALVGVETVAPAAAE